MEKQCEYINIPLKWQQTGMAKPLPRTNSQVASAQYTFDIRCDA